MPVPLSEDILTLENLTTYPQKGEASHNMEFKRVNSYGNTDNLQIGVLGGFSVDNSGRIYLNDMQQRTIFVLEENGQLAGQIGRRGSGPGEFQNGPFPYIISDKLYAIDLMSLRLSMFSTDSFELLQTVNLNPKNQSRHNGLIDANLRQVFPIHPDRFLLSFAPFYNEMPSSAGQKLEGGNVDYYIMDNEGHIISEKVLSHKDTPFLTGLVDGQIHMASRFQLFNKSLVAVAEDGGFFTAMSTDFLIKEYSAEGKYKHAFYYPFTHVHMQKEDALQIQTTDFLREIVQQNDLPEAWPALNDLLVDDENRLWVSTIVENFEIYEWWVLEETGELIAKFEWPRDEPIEIVKNGYMYTRETDEETGLQQIVRYRFEMENS